MIQYKSNFYSVPLIYARKKLLIKEINEQGIGKLEIYFGGKIVAIHELNRGRNQWLSKDDHINRRGQEFYKRRLPKQNNVKPMEVKIRPLSYYDELVG